MLGKDGPGEAPRSVPGMFKREQPGAHGAGMKTGGRWRERMDPDDFVGPGDEFGFDSKGNGKPSKCSEQGSSMVGLPRSRGAADCHSELSGLLGEAGRCWEMAAAGSHV